MDGILSPVLNVAGPLPGDDIKTLHPVGGRPSDVTMVVQDYACWKAARDLPSPFVHADALAISAT